MLRVLVCLFVVLGFVEGDATLRGLPIKSEPRHGLVETNGVKDRRLSQSQGKYRVLVLLVRFTDHKKRVLPEKSHFEALCKDEMAPYMLHQSYGTYIVECDVFDWEDTDSTEAFYAAGVSNLKETNEAAKLFHPVLTKLDNQNKINWSNYDVDQDGQIDSLLVYHSGYAAEQGNGESCGGNPPENRIHSQGHRGSPEGWFNKDLSIRVSGYALASAFDQVCEGTAKPATMGVMCHEWTHTFGTPDLYDVSSRKSGKLGGLGVFDLMSNPFGPKRDGRAGSLGAYTKERIGWLTPVVIEHDGVYEIRSSSRTPDLYRIELSNPDEYLLIENRGLLDYDEGMPGRGLLIYHVDDAMQNQNRTGFPGQAGWPKNGNHYKVAILPKDGNYDLEQEKNNGDATDYWGPGDTLGATDNQYPNTHSYQGGVLKRTGIVITDISEPGYTMNFTVKGVAPAPLNSTPMTSPPAAAPVTPTPTTVSITLPTDSPTVKATAAPSKITTVTLPPIVKKTATPTQSPIDATATPTQAPIDGGHVVIEGTVSPTQAASTGEPVSRTQPPATIDGEATMTPTRLFAPTAHPTTDEGGATGESGAEFLSLSFRIVLPLVAIFMV